MTATKPKSTRGATAYHYIITITWPIGTSGYGQRSEVGVTPVRTGETRSAVFARLYEEIVQSAKDRGWDADNANILFFSLEPDDLASPLAAKKED